jgi:hypothetical protein
MPVTDEQEATLHAQLAGRVDEHKRLLDALDPVAARTGYSALVSAAFAVAVDDRFPEGTTAADVIEFVADVRSRTEGTRRIDPRVAERVIQAILFDESIDDIDARVSFQTQLVLLAALIADAHLDDAELDKFMNEARKLGDTWLA